MAERKRATRSRSPGKQKPVAVKTDETILFKFLTDRFGFSPDAAAKDRDEITYAREALRALDHWASAMDELFGDIDRGLEAAGYARILPYNPTWSSTLESRQRVRDNLGAAPERDEPGKGSALVDQKTRDAVEELRIYLRMLWTWRKTFEAGLWIATVAARGSIEGNPQRRLLRGLGAIAAVCEFDAIDTPDRIVTELFDVALHASKLVADSREKWAATGGIASTIKGATGALDQQFSEYYEEFVEQPAQLYDWADRLRERLTPLQYADRLAGPQWTDVEAAYWRQWNWPMSGAVVRRDLSVKMSVLDLMMAARYDGATFLHWRGGLLSIAQWSRILAIASPERSQIMQGPADAALGQLGFSEMIELGRDSARAPPPLVALSIVLNDSTLSLWRPDPAIRAFALLPRERQEADERIAHYGAGGGKARPASRLRDISTGTGNERAARLHLIEAPPGRDIGQISAAMNELAHGLAWGRVYFAAEKPPLGTARRSMRSSARNIRELVLEVRHKFPELFPDEFTSRWRRWFVGRYRIFQQGSVYAVLRQVPTFRWLERLLTRVNPGEN